MTQRPAGLARARPLRDGPRVFRAACVAALALTVACRRQTADSPRPRGDALTVELWLSCEECQRGELDSVITLGPRAVPLLSKAVEGPASQSLLNMARSAASNYVIMRAQFERMSPDDQRLRPLTDSAEFVDGTVRRYQLSYRLRAAQALHAISPNQARAVFQRALCADSSRPELRLGPVLRSYLDSLSRAP
jgi:hypothetical protein